VVASIKDSGYHGPLQVLGVAGPTAMTSRVVSFCFLFESYESGPQKMQLISLQASGNRPLDPLSCSFARPFYPSPHLQILATSCSLESCALLEDGRCTSHPGSSCTCPPGPVLGHVAARLLHIGDEAIMLPLLIVALECLGPIRVIRLLVLLCFLGVEGCFFSQDIFIGDG
jgi:hypothetical protein